MLEHPILAAISAVFFKCRERRKVSVPVAEDRRRPRHMTPKGAQQELLSAIDRFSASVKSQKDRLGL